MNATQKAVACWLGAVIEEFMPAAQEAPLDGDDREILSDLLVSAQDLIDALRRRLEQQGE